MSEQRDQWGETAEERHTRILARDLAWMTYAEACARDGVPRSERDHLIFNDGYAAGRADYLPASGVVAEETEAAWSITTETEANALPVGSIIRDNMGDARQKVSDLGWEQSGVVGWWGPTWVAFPAEVLWVPMKQEGQVER